MSGLITLDQKPTIASVKTAQKLQEAKSDYLTRQFQRFLNDVINDNLDLNYKWNIQLYGGIFTWEDEALAVKDMVLNGATGLLPKYLGYYSMTVEDYKGCSTYIDSYGIKIETPEQQFNQSIQQDELKLQNKQLDISKQQVAATIAAKKESATTASSSSKPKAKTTVKSTTTTKSTKSSTSTKSKTSKKVGRPKLSDDQIENDNTDASRQSGGNSSENKKDYSLDIEYEEYEDYEEYEEM